MADDDVLSLLDYSDYENDDVFDEEPRQQHAADLAEIWAEQQQPQPPQENDLDATLPAIELTKAEKKKEKNRKKGLKGREKKNERMVANAIALAEGTKSREEVAEDNMRRRIEGIVSRERGRLRQEADVEIERRLAEWRADLESGKVNLDRGIASKERADRRRRQDEHLRRRRNERQRKRRAAEKGWAALGRHAVLGSKSDDGLDSMIDAELAVPTLTVEDDESAPGPSRPVAVVQPRVFPLIDLRD